MRLHLFGIRNGTFAASPVVWGSGPAMGQFFFENLNRQSPTASLPDLVSPNGSGDVTVLLNFTKYSYAVDRRGGKSL
jgi:hypothetical protein